jgi:hypothetical protein
MEFGQETKGNTKVSKLIERLSQRKSGCAPIPKRKKTKTKEELAEIRKSLVRNKKPSADPPRPSTAPTSPNGKDIPPSDLLDRLTKGIKPTISRKEMHAVNRRHRRNMTQREAAEHKFSVDTAAKLEDIKRRRLAMKEYQKKT